MKTHYLHIFAILATVLTGCAGPGKIKILGDEYWVLPFPRNEPITVPGSTSGGGQGSGSNGTEGK
ncbi:MAG: hypothetical protein IDH49_06980 [Gammaproteobacteria bacterium]|nr:hypothetical protein [Gammaproteobacteria bacterium]